MHQKTEYHYYAGILCSEASRYTAEKIFRGAFPLILKGPFSLRTTYRENKEKKKKRRVKRLKCRVLLFVIILILVIGFMIYGIHTLDLIPFSFSNLLNHQWIQSIRETLSENVSSYQGIGDQCIGQDVQHIETKAFGKKTFEKNFLIDFLYSFTHIYWKPGFRKVFRHGVVCKRKEKANGPQTLGDRSVYLARKRKPY